MSQEQEEYQIESYNRQTGEFSSRTVNPLQYPKQRFARPETPSLDEVKDQISELSADIAGATQDYDHASTHLDEYYQPLKLAREKVSELRQQLAEAEAEVSGLESHGSPRDGFLNFIVECEGRLERIARQLLARFL